MIFFFFDCISCVKHYIEVLVAFIATFNTIGFYFLFFSISVSSYFLQVSYRGGDRASIGVNDDDLTILVQGAVEKSGLEV